MLRQKNGDHKIGFASVFLKLLMGADLLFTGEEKRIRSWLLKRGSLLDFCDRPCQSDSISQVIHSWIKLWRLYEKNVTPFSLELNLGRFRDTLQVTMTTDVQPKFSYLSFLVGKSTDKINSGFEMWCCEISKCNAGYTKSTKPFNGKHNLLFLQNTPKITTLKQLFIISYLSAN